MKRLTVVTNKNMFGTFYGIKGTNCCYNANSFDVPDGDRACIREAINKLAEYENLEEQGLLTKLPSESSNSNMNIYVFEKPSIISSTYIKVLASNEEQALELVMKNQNCDLNDAKIKERWKKGLKEKISKPQVISIHEYD